MQKFFARDRWFNLLNLNKFLALYTFKIPAIFDRHQLFANKLFIDNVFIYLCSKLLRIFKTLKNLYCQFVTFGTRRRLTIINYR